VLILNISFAAPFNISKFYLDPSTSNIQAGFSTFIIADAFAFAFSMAATFWLSLAGLSIIDMRTRVIYLNNLNNGSICLSSAFCSMVIVFLLGIFAVVAHVDAIITSVACVIARGRYTTIRVHNISSLLGVISEAWVSNMVPHFS
jgi:hypothetical protein